ncbi:hypothetical protein N8H71_20535 [Pseudomonas koreensis]|uniref:hypothetical protein n=1 Tax=Pseudomonas koreensis TaxID=198620 RepID=UPI0021C6F09C|nr:hypothetical protein [Pseudomonas koreensis]MCU0073986.1 hypothetical protein [Pseudomonas koreensis]
MAKLKRWESDAAAKVTARTSTTETDTSEARPPVFSFEYLQNGWCIQDCETVERSKMLERLRVLGKMSWRELRKEHRHRYGCETIERSSLKVGIPAFLTGDVRLLVFRAFERVAMVGYKNQRIFYVVWIDREFKLYKH